MYHKRTVFKLTRLHCWQVFATHHRWHYMHIKHTHKKICAYRYYNCTKKKRIVLWMRVRFPDVLSKYSTLHYKKKIKNKKNKSPRCMQRGCNDNMTPDILSFLSLPITSKLLYEECSIVQVETLIWVIWVF